MRKPSPALIVSIVALLVASTGTSYAAANFVITNSNQVKAGSLLASDLAPAARNALKGATGPRGPAGLPASAARPATITRMFTVERPGTDSIRFEFPLSTGSWLVTTGISVDGYQGGGGGLPGLLCSGSSEALNRPRAIVDADDPVGFGFDRITWVDAVVVPPGPEDTDLLSCNIIGSGKVRFTVVIILQRVSGFNAIPE